MTRDEAEVVLQAVEAANVKDGFLLDILETRLISDDLMVCAAIFHIRLVNFVPPSNLIELQNKLKEKY